MATDTALLISTADVTSSQRVAEEVVDRLSRNGRNYLDLALLTPGDPARRNGPLGRRRGGSRMRSPWWRSAP